MSGLRSFLVGDEPYKVETPWSGLVAFVISIGFILFQVVIAMLLAIAILAALYDLSSLGKSLDGLTSAQKGDLVNQVVLGCEILSFGFVYMIASLRGGRASEVLGLRAPKNLVPNLVFALVGLLVFYGLFALVLSQFFQSDAVQTKGQMQELFSMLQSSGYVWAGVAAIVVGAPFFEEAVFRGFLLNSLSKTWMGFWGGAVLTSGLWAIIHAGYATSMLIGLFCLGMLFSLVVRRSGSIWLTILLHGIWNAFASWATISGIGG